MTENQTRKKSGNVKRIALIFAIIVVIGLSTIIFFINQDGKDSHDIGLGNDLFVTNISSYDGPYVEDGSDEPVSGVLMLEVENRGMEAVEYAVINAQIGEVKADFTVVALMPGAKAIVLEKNRMAYDASLDYMTASITCGTLARYQYPLELYADKLELLMLDGAVNVTNISDKDITKNIAIYYKNKEDGVYQGGIAYRIILEGGIKAGEIRQQMTKHLDAEKSEILFVTMM